MLPLPSAPKLYLMAQDFNWGDTSMGESQWIANMKTKYGSGWRRSVHNSLVKKGGTMIGGGGRANADIKTQEVKNDAVAGQTFGLGFRGHPFERPVDWPVSWKPPSTIKNETQCLNQLSLTKCAPEDRFVVVDKSAYHLYGFNQDGTENKKVPWFKYERLGGPGTMYTERSVAEQNNLNQQMDTWCDGVVNSCYERFTDNGTSTPPPAPVTPDPVTPAPTTPPPSGDGAKNEEEVKEDFMKKYKFPLIAAGVVIVAMIVMMGRNKQAQPTVIVTK
jgi:hypothetical protein